MRRIVTIFNEARARRAAVIAREDYLDEKLDRCKGGVCDYLGGLCNRHMYLAEQDSLQLDRELEAKALGEL